MTSKLKETVVYVIKDIKDIQEKRWIRTAILSYIAAMNSMKHYTFKEIQKAVDTQCGWTNPEA